MEYRCPTTYSPGGIRGCGVTFTAEIDDEGFVACPECGMWFKGEQVCRGCETRYPYDPDADYCPECVRVNIGLPTVQTVAVLLEIKASDDHEAWKIIDRILNRDGDDELVAYTELPKDAAAHAEP